jgi:hypothetical protein
MGGVEDAAAAFITLAVLAWLLWASGKGLDVTDEGFYLLTARHPEDVVMMPTAFHHVTSWLFWAVGGSIAALRIIGVLGTAAAGAFLADAALAVSGARRSWLAVSVVTTSALVAYAWLLLTPSYNTYNAWAVSGATACTLRALAAMRTQERTRWRAWMSGSGLFLGFMFFVKFPTAAAMGALVTTAIAAWPGLSRRERVAAFAWIAMGAAGAAAIIFITLVSPRGWWREAIAGLDQTTRLGAGHGLSGIERYAREVWAHVIAGTRPVIWLSWVLGFASAVMLAAASSVQTRRAARVALWLVIAAAAVRSALVTIAWIAPPMMSPYALLDPFPFGVARFHLHWLVLVMAIAAGAWLGARFRRTEIRAADSAPSADVNRQRLVVGLLLAGGTAAAAFGTANPIYLNFMLALGSWSALMILAVRYASATLDWSGVGNATMLTVLTLAALQIVGGTIAAPYGLNEGLLRQTVDTAIGSPPSRVSLDPDTHRLVVDLQRLAGTCGFREGDDLLAFHSMPGLVFAMGGRSPGLAWYTSGLPGSRVVNEQGLEVAGAARVARAFILQTPDAMPWLGTLARLGIEFPARYAYCGTVTRRLRGLAFELKLWRPASRPASPQGAAAPTR